MSLSGRYTLLSPLLLLASTHVATAEVLQHNPFKRPTLEGAAQAEVAGVTPKGDLRLRATLAAGDGSLANINGKLFRLGDEVSGYQIREISEGSVVLFRNDQQRRLTVRDDKEE
jgi:hypothetical protein